jgi:TonB family protein
MFFCLWAGSSFAFEETVKRFEGDAGVRVPVMTKAPELVQFVSAVYPPAAQAQGLTASVKLSVVILADGTPGEVLVTQGPGQGFDEAAQAAVKQFVFSPAEVDGMKAPIQIEYVYHFVLETIDAGVGVPENADGGTDLSTPVALTAQLKGVLLSRGSRSKVPGALVRCLESESETTSDEQGEFSLALPAGLCSMRVTSSDSEGFKTTETLEANETREVKYYLFPKAIGYQTIVKGTRDKKEVVKRTITRQELLKSPGTFGDPIRVIQNFPGVARAPFSFGQLIVRGANPNQTLTFFDGVEIPLLFHLAGGPSVVNGEFLDKLDFFPGGFGARYGRAVGGVVDVTSRKGATDTLHGAVKIDLLDSYIFLEAPLTKDISVSVAGRRSYIDALLPLILTGNSILVLPVYWDYQLRIDGGKRGQRLETGSSTWSVFAFGSDDKLKIVASGAGQNRDVALNFQTTFHRVMATWATKFGDTTFKITPYVGYNLANISFGNITIKGDTYAAGLRADLGVEVSPWLTIRAGADISHDTLVGTAEIPNIAGIQYIGFPGAEPKIETQRISQTASKFDGAVFAEADFTLGKFTATPGIRASQGFAVGQTRHAFDPRLWLRFEPFENTSIKGSIGLYTQLPASQNFVPPPFGTPSLSYERAFQTSLGVMQKFTENINLDVTGFFNRRFENVVTPGARVVNADGSVTNTVSANEGLGKAYGLEVQLRHEVTKNFFGWLAYTFSRSEERRAGTPQGYQLTANDQTHILTLVGSYRLPYGFEVGARFRYVTGRPKSPLIHKYDIYQADSNSFTGTFGDARSARIKDFNQLDVRIDKTWIFTSWSLDLYLDIQNVYNAQNVEASFFDYRFRQEFDVPGIPILPVLGVKATF